MKKIATLLSFIGLSLGSMLLNSCGCCTAEEGAPALRPEPSFSTITEKAPVYIEPAK